MPVRSSGFDSTLFMEDPVPPKILGKSKDVTTAEKNYVAKGSDLPKSEIYVITDKESKTANQVNREALKAYLVELKAYAHDPIRTLNEQSTESFKSIVEAMKILYNSPAVYEIILGDVKEIFSDVKNIKPGTVAAFFVGCQRESKFPAGIGCDPVCVSGLPPKESDGFYSACEEMVLIYTDGTLAALNDKRSSHCYIYVESEKFNGFLPAIIDKLREANVEKCTLVYGNKDGTYRDVSNPILLVNLPRVEFSDKYQNDKSALSSVSESLTQNNTLLIIIIVILVIMLIILLLAFIYRSRYYKKAE